VSVLRQWRDRRRVEDVPGGLQRVACVGDRIETVRRDDPQRGLAVDALELPDECLVAEVRQAVGFLVDEVQSEPALLGVELHVAILQDSHRRAVVEGRDLVHDPARDVLLDRNLDVWPQRHPHLLGVVDLVDHLRERPLRPIAIELDTLGDRLAPQPMRVPVRGSLPHREAEAVGLREPGNERLVVAAVEFDQRSHGRASQVRVMRAALRQVAPP
jgi:hypothetical protein